MQSHSGFGHMTATRPSAIIISGSVGIAELAVQSDTPTKMAATRAARSVGESPHAMAARLNRTSSTLMLNSPSTKQHYEEGEESAHRGIGLASPAAGATPSSVDSFSFAGLPPGPGPLHLAAKYVPSPYPPPLPSPYPPSPIPLPSPLIPQVWKPSLVASFAEARTRCGHTR